MVQQDGATRDPERLRIGGDDQAETDTAIHSLERRDDVVGQVGFRQQHNPAGVPAKQALELLDRVEVTEIEAEFAGNLIDGAGPADGAADDHEHAVGDLSRAAA